MKFDGAGDRIASYGDAAANFAGNKDFAYASAPLNDLETTKAERLTHITCHSTLPLSSG